MTTRTNVPLVDLVWQHEQIKGDVEQGWRDVLAEASFILGPQVEEFEANYAQFSGVTNCMGVGSGTDALELCLRALDIGPGDEVVLPANTFIATALAVTRVGATPVLADCDPEHYLIHPEAIDLVVTERTKAVIPVHLYGQMAPAREIGEAFADLWVIEDGAQSQGATRHGEQSGSVGDIAATSFYPGKNIGAYGDGGAVLTSDPELASRVRKLRNWGSEVKYHHPEKGFNSRLDTLQGVVLSAKLKRLSQWNRLRQEAAERYAKLLADAATIRLPSVMHGNEHVWHLYVVQVEDREQVLGKLKEAGVGAGIHYPIPIHLQGAYAELGHKVGDFPNAEDLAQNCLSIPLYPGIHATDQERVAEIISSS